MGLDVRLLEAAEKGEAGWRVYGWDGPWVSLGRFQRAERALASGWDRWCARPTGGRAVLHGHDVTLAYALPHVGDSRRLKEVYRRLIGPLVEALNACGLECQLAEATRYAGSGQANEDCFAFRSSNDVVCPETGKKVCGCALRIGEHGSLLQASIPYAEQLVPPASAISGAVGEPVRRWDWNSFEDAFAHVMASR
jgi:lipoate-protein ligase A